MFSPPSPPPMVAEPEDTEMDILELPEPTNFSVFGVRVRCESPMLSFGRKSPFFPIPKPPSPPLPPPPPKSKVTLTDQLAEMTKERDELRSKVRQLERAVAGHAGDDKLVHEHYIERERNARKARTSERHSLLATVDAAEQETKRLRVDKDGLKAANLKAANLKKALDKETKAKEVAEAAKEVAEAALMRQYKIANDLREDVNASVHRDEYQSKVDALESAEADVRANEREMSELNEKLEEATEKLAEATAGPGKGAFAEANAPKYLEAMKIACGITNEYTSVPTVEPPPLSSGSKWRKQSVRHMSAVLKGRGKGEGINMIAEALERNGYLEQLATTKLFMPYAKGIVRATISSTQKHWSALHAVHVWDQLELSLRQEYYI